MDILKDLNDEQMEAVTTTEGYVRVIAGAGSGKTKALTHRYAFLVNEFGISTSNILCATFTNKAANEMKKRVRSMIGDNDTGFICTFHGFCVRLLREDIHAINYPQNFIVMDAEDTETILKTVYETSNIQSRTYTFSMAREYIKRQKISSYAHIPYLLELDIQKLKTEYMNEKDIKRKVFLGYLYEQRKCYGLDFDDLITLALYILETSDEKRQKWQERMQYVMVDEFQDVSDSNYKLVEILSGFHKNLFIVGDPDQTIYSWRGADINNILNFDKCHKNTKTIIMNRNYRSTPEVLGSANTLISKNKNRIEKDLIPIKQNNQKTIYYHAKTTKLEAQWIVTQIQELLRQGVQYSDIAVLYRAHYVSRSIEEAFIQNKIPYILYSGIEFYKRKEIKDAVSYLRMVLYADDLSFQRVINEPKRNVGKKRLSFLIEYAEQYNMSMYNALKVNIDNNLFVGTKAKAFVDVIEKYQQLHKEKSISDILTNLLHDSGYEQMMRTNGEQERLDNLAELKQSIFEFERTSGEENTLEEYLQNIALFSNTDKEDRKNTIKMMTVHAAKGLEFPYVFICGFNEGIFPSKNIKRFDEMEEERRLAYVAYTRAETMLFISDAEGVNYDNSIRYPSRFIFVTGEDCLKYLVELEDDFVMQSMQWIRLSEDKFSSCKTQIKVGDIVEHVKFGRGKVIAKENDSSVFVIKFDKLATERNLSFTAPLKVISQ